MPLRGLLPVSRVARFVTAAARTDTEDWREALARTLLDGIHPERWTDAHVVDFEAHLRTLRADFMRHQSLVAERQTSGFQEVFRVSWLAEGIGEVSEVVSIPEGGTQKVEVVVKQLASALHQDDRMAPVSRRIQLAALARLTAELMKDGAESDER